MPRDTIPVNHEFLRAAKLKYRQLVIELEESKRPANDMLHPAYKLGQFLEEALGVAWKDADARAPDEPQLFGD